jgi:hypothetical protein
MHSPGDIEEKGFHPRGWIKKRPAQKTPTNIFWTPRPALYLVVYMSVQIKRESLRGGGGTMGSSSSTRSPFKHNWIEISFSYWRVDHFTAHLFSFLIVVLSMNGGYEGGSQHISRHVYHWLALFRANQLIIFPRGCQQQLKRVHQQLYRLLVQDADISQSQQSASNEWSARRFSSVCCCWPPSYIHSSDSPMFLKLHNCCSYTSPPPPPGFDEGGSPPLGLL